MSAKIYLETVDAPTEADTVLYFPKMPAFSARDDENLACGNCKTVIGRNTSTRTVHGQFVVQSRLLVQCDCGRFVVVPAQIDQSPAQPPKVQKP